MYEPADLSRITARAVAVAEARAVEAQAELRALAEHMNRSLGQSTRFKVARLGRGDQNNH